MCPDSDEPTGHNATAEGNENVRKILLRARQLNQENIDRALEAGDIERSLRIASNEAKVEIFMRSRGIDI